MALSIKPYIENKERIHLIGIGGVSMNSLGELLLSRGVPVSGSDRLRTDVTARLEALGAKITYEHKPENVEGASLIVRTAAVHDDNPEIVRAHELGIPVMERAEAWGHLMRDYDNVVCLAGTHGKTTSTSMMTLMTMEAQMDPTVMVGSNLPAIGGTLRIGGKGCFVAESCEYCNSFLSFFPTVAVILNVEADHLDFFKDLADVEHSFRRFAELVPIGGHVVANMDDEGARDALRGISQPIFWFSYDDPAAQCRAENVVWTDGLPSFDIYIRGSYYAHVSLRVGGKHNVMNALAAASAAYLLGVSGEAVGLGLATFTGAGRRFEYKGSFHGADVYDDYAHHPGELHALLEMAKTLPYKRIICAFQPHTYTRTKALFNDFVKELRVPDVVVLAEIYAAREQNDIGISSMDLSREIPGSVYCPTLDKVTAALARIACPGDLILTVGAGDIFKAGEKLLKEEK